MRFIPAARTAPLILPFDGIAPAFDAASARVDPDACLLGKVTLGARAGARAGAVLRADGHYVRAGDDFFIGEGSTVHIAHDVYPAIIGARVTVGRDAVVHACAVGDDCVIGDGAVILDGAIVGDGVVLEPGAVVFPRGKLDSGQVYAGAPAKPVRAIEAAERETLAASLRARAPETAANSLAGAPVDPSGFTRAFAAINARLGGEIVLRDRSSVFFGCRLDAGTWSITVGENTNIQDNSSIVCATGPMRIGQNAVVGHNVRMESCDIGDRALIGIGSFVAAGTNVGEDVLLAAGARTAPGQRLEPGWIYGGSPARQIGRFEGKKRDMISLIVEQYCVYADQYRAAQARA